MTRMTYSFFALVVLTLPTPAGEPRDRWHDSLDEALAAARQENKPVFLVFRCER